MKKLSIITICYNDPDLETTCKSIVEQSWQDFEWVVVDGASNEETQKIWDKYKYRIDKFISEPDKGIYNAQNKGIKLASGKYLNFMNSGDSFYCKDTLKEVFENNEHNDEILYGRANKINYGEEKSNYIDSLPKKINDLYFVFGSICSQAMFIQRDLFEKYGYYDESYKIASDKDRWVIFQKHGAKFHYLSNIICNYDCQGLSSTNKELLNKEFGNITNKYFTKEEIEKANQPNYTFWEQIFSVKNTKDRKYKIFKIFGLSICLK